MPLLQLMFFAAVGPLFAAGISSSGIYNSSKTPSNLPWDTYNYCNAPHVNAKHYILPTNDSKAQLVYMNVVMRHHKVCVLFPPNIVTFTCSIVPSALQTTFIPPKIHLTQLRVGTAVILSTRYTSAEPRRFTGRPLSPRGIPMSAPSGTALAMLASLLVKV
jgi:hypothetical protein